MTAGKIASGSVPLGANGEVPLARGERLALRLWRDEPPNADKPTTVSGHETVGYVLKGKADLVLAGETVRLEPGDSWLVPAGVEHTYRIVETFSAIEATAPPAA